MTRIRKSCIMGGSSRGVAESAVRRLGPLPRPLLVNMALSQGAVREFLAGVPRGGAGSDNVVRPGLNLQGATVTQQRDWYRITNQAGGGPVVVDIFDEIGFWGVNAAAFQHELAQVSASEITVNLSSPGGEIFEGIAIYNALRTHPATVTVRVSALAASIASVIAQAGDHIVMLSGSQMMIHEGMGLCAGNAAEMKQMAEVLDRQSANIADIYAERAGGTPEEWRERMRAETWFNAEEAVAAGLADEVDTAPRKGEQPVEAMAARWDLSVFRHAGREQAPAPVLNTAAPAAEPAAAPGLELRGEHGPELIDLLPQDAPEPVTEPQPTTGPVYTISIEALADVEATAASLQAALTGIATANGLAEEPVVASEPDSWAALTAHLNQPAPDPWAGLVAHLTSSSAATSTHA